MSAIPSPAGMPRPMDPHLQHHHYPLTSQPFLPPPPPLQLKPSMQHPIHKPVSHPAGSNPPVLTLGQKIAQLNEAVWLQIGSLSELMEDLEGAVSAYEHALRHNQWSIPALFAIAAIMRARDQFQKAIDYLQSVVKLDPQNGDAWGQLGHCSLMVENLQDAYTFYQQALYHLPNPKEPKLWYGIGILYDRYGYKEYAEEVFSEVMRISPDFEKANEIHYRLGIIYKQQQRFAKSLDCFRQIVNDPPSPLTEQDIWYQIGHSHEEQKEYDAAKGAYKRVLDRNPNHAKVLQHLGILYHRQSSNPEVQEQAIEYLERSLRVDPNNAQSWYLLGRSYIAHSNYPKAYEAYQQAVFRDANNPKFWCSIGVLYYKINQFHDALDAYARSLHIDPYIPEAWFNLGTLYESCNNQVNDALDAYFRATELDPNNQQIKTRVHILQTCQAKGVTTTIPPPPPQDVQLQDLSTADDSVMSPHPPHNQSAVKHEVAPPKMNTMPHLSQPAPVSPPTQFSSQPPPPSMITQHPPQKMDPQPAVQRISDWPRHPDLPQPVTTIPPSSQAPQSVHLFDPRASHSLPPPPHPANHLAHPQSTYSSVPVSPRSQVPPPSVLAGPPSVPSSRKIFESPVATPAVPSATLPSFNSAFMRRDIEWNKNTPPAQKVTKPSGSMRRGSFAKEEKERKEQARQEKARAKEVQAQMKEEKREERERAKEEKSRSKKASQEASHRKIDKERWPRENQADLVQHERQSRRDTEGESHREKLRSVSPGTHLPPQLQSTPPPSSVPFPHPPDESQHLHAAVVNLRDRTGSVSVKRRHEPDSNTGSSAAAPPPTKKAALTDHPAKNDGGLRQADSDQTEDNASNVLANRTEREERKGGVSIPVSNSPRKEHDPGKAGDGPKKAPLSGSGRRNSANEPRQRKSWLDTAISSKPTDRHAKHDRVPVSPEPPREQEVSHEEPMERPAREMDVDEDYDFEGDTDGDEQMKEVTAEKATDDAGGQDGHAATPKYHRSSLPSPASHVSGRERQTKDTEMDTREEAAQDSDSKGRHDSNDEDAHMKTNEVGMPRSPAASTTTTSALVPSRQDPVVDRDGDATMRKSPVESQEPQQQQQPASHHQQRDDDDDDVRDTKMDDLQTETGPGDNMTATTSTQGAEETKRREE